MTNKDILIEIEEAIESALIDDTSDPNSKRRARHTARIETFRKAKAEIIRMRNYVDFLISQTIEESPSVVADLSKSGDE